uniref:Peptidase A1 domain-containing protein n=1 Tax=Oryza barthii TaxID=65489 RepID=A0A0D3GFR6_9ORYZ
MEVLLPLLLACSLLFTIATPIRDITDVCASQISDFQHLNSSGLHLTLHHPQSPCSPAPLPSDLPFSAVVTHDDARIAHLASRLANNHPTSSSSSSLLHGHRKKKAAAGIAGSQASSSSVPLTPGASVAVGNYVTRLGLGTPAIPYVMVVDTGSSLTWLQCSPCSVSCHRQAGPVFDPRASGTYAAVQCSSSECGELQAATLNPSACSASNVCIYQASYGDSSYSVGYLSKDTAPSAPAASRASTTAAAKQRGPLRPLRGAHRPRQEQALAALPARPEPRLRLLLLPPDLVGGGGLPLHRVVQPRPVLVHAHGDEPPSTPRSTSSPWSGISVAGAPLAVSPSEYGSLPTIIDSGTVITRLPPNVYTALSRAVAAAMAGAAPRAPTYSILDTCFRGSAAGLRVPRVDMAFAGGATLALSPGNVLIDVDDSTTCLAFAPTGGTAIIGNTQQQTFSVVYDVAQSRIGFAAGGCS